MDRRRPSRRHRNERPEDLLPILARDRAVIAVLMLARADGVGVRALGAHLPLIAELDDLARHRHGEISIAETQKPREEIADHPIVIENVMVAVTPLVEEVQRHPFDHKGFHRHVVFALPLLEHLRERAGIAETCWYFCTGRRHLRRR